MCTEPRSAPGGGIDAAMADLMAEGRRQAEEIVLALQDQHPEQDGDTEWPFEVIDVRLVRGHRGDPGEAWVAVGTLCSADRTPWSGSYWDQARR